jgi:hypothetical protein
MDNLLAKVILGATIYILYVIIDTWRNKRKLKKLESQNSVSGSEQMEK